MIADLEKAGFANRGGKGSHRNFTHPKGLRVTLSGKDGDDATPYQEKEMKRQIKAPEYLTPLSGMPTSTITTKKKAQSEGARYLKIVEWSEEDGCFVGSAPPLIGPCCHGEEEVEVFKQLSKIVDGWVEILEREGRPLPDSTAHNEYSGKFFLRVNPELHNALAVRAVLADQSLNAYCSQALSEFAGRGGSLAAHQRKRKSASGSTQRSHA